MSSSRAKNIHEREATHLSEWKSKTNTHKIFISTFSKINFVAAKSKVQLFSVSTAPHASFKAIHLNRFFALVS